MPQKTWERSVERSIAGPEFGKRQDALATQLLHEPALREDHTEDIPQCRQRHEDGQGALGRRPHDVAEERRGDEPLGGEHLLLWHGGKVRDVDQHVKHADDADCEGRCDLERADGVLGLAEGVVGVAVADVAPDDVVERRDDAVGAARRPLKRVGEVVGLLVELDAARQRRPASKDHDQDDEDLDAAEEVLESQPPFECEAVDQEREGEAGQADAALVPPVDLDVGGVQDVFAEDDGVAAGPAEEDNVAGVEAGGQELGLTPDVFQVVLLATVLWDRRAEFHEHRSPGQGDEHTGYPHKQRETNAAGEAQDRTWRGEDSCTDDAVHDQEDGSRDTDLSFRLTRIEDPSIVCIESQSKVYQ